MMTETEILRRMYSGEPFIFNGMRPKTPLDEKVLAKARQRQSIKKEGGTPVVVGWDDDEYDPDDEDPEEFEAEDDTDYFDIDDDDPDEEFIPHDSH